MMTISIALCFNNQFCLVAAGTISSIIRHASEHIQYDIYIVQDDITEQNRYHIKSLNWKENVNIIFIEIEHSVYTKQDLNYREIFTKHTFSRLFLHKLLPNIDKLVYLDSDTMVTSDIAELFGQDLDGYSIGACLAQSGWNGTPSELKKRKLNPNSLKLLKLLAYPTWYDYLNDYLGLNVHPNSTYFNAGVMLLNLKKVGKALDKELPQLLQNKYYWPDQDILNIIFENDKKILDKRFNIASGGVFRYFSDYSKYPDIIHFLGGPLSKPTETMNNRSYAYAYWEEISHTNFYYPAIEHFIDKKISYMESRIIDDLNNKNSLSDLYYNLRRFNKLHKRRKYIRFIIKLLVDRKKYKKLKTNSGQFFNDSKSLFIRFLGRYYKD